MTALIRVGLSAESLTAAGVPADGAGGVVDAVQSYLAQHPLVIESADAAYASAKTSADRLERLVRSGLGTPEDATAYGQAAQDLSAATTARQQVLDAVFSAGSAGLASGTSERLSRIRANQAAWTAPLEFLVVSRSEADWVHVKQALANEKISARYGEEPDAGDQSFLGTCRANGDVVAAKAALESNLTSVREAWTAAASN